MTHAELLSRLISNKILNKKPQITRRSISNLQQNSLLKSELYSQTQFVDVSSTDEFRLYMFLYKFTKHPTCPTCKNFLDMSHHIRAGKFREFCCDACIDQVASRTKANNTKIARYGSMEACQQLSMEKYKQTMLERYGVDHNFKSPEIQENIKLTLKERYGVDNPSKNQKIKNQQRQTCKERYGGDGTTFSSSMVQEKTKQTMLERYGVDHVSKIEGIQNKIIDGRIRNFGSLENSYAQSTTKSKNTCLIKYGVDHLEKLHIDPKIYEILNDVEWLTNKQHNEKWTLSRIAEFLGVSFSLVANSFKQLHLEIKHYRSSTAEKELSEVINECNYSTKNSARGIIKSKELDVYVPELNLAFEFNGIFWHSELKQRITRTYHQDKVVLCNNKGIRLIHIYEHEWVKYKEIICSNVKRVLGKLSTSQSHTIRIITREEFEDREDWKNVKDCDVDYFCGVFCENQLINVTGLKTKDEQMHVVYYQDSLQFDTRQLFGDLLRFIRTTFYPNILFEIEDGGWIENKMLVDLGFVLKQINPPTCLYFNHKSPIETISLVLAEDLAWEDAKQQKYDRIWKTNRLLFCYDC